MFVSSQKKASLIPEKEAPLVTHTQCDNVEKVIFIQTWYRHMRLKRFEKKALKLESFAKLKSKLLSERVFYNRKKILHCHKIIWTEK
jgi:hypothetical protein